MHTILGRHSDGSGRVSRRMAEGNKSEGSTGEGRGTKARLVFLLLSNVSNVSNEEVTDYRCCLIY